MDERPENVIDTFEDISYEEKNSRFSSNLDTVQDKIDKSTEVALAEIQETLFKVFNSLVHVGNIRVIIAEQKFLCCCFVLEGRWG